MFVGGEGCLIFFEIFVYMSAYACSGLRTLSLARMMMLSNAQEAGKERE